MHLRKKATTPSTRYNDNRKRDTRESTKIWSYLIVVSITLQLLILCNTTISPKVVVAEAVRPQQSAHRVNSVQSFHIGRCSSTVIVRPSPLIIPRGGALVPEVHRRRSSSWKLGFTGSSDESSDRDDNDDDKFSTVLTDLISELLVKFKKEDAINALATRLLSDETSQAVKSIRSLITNFPDFGVVDIFAQYPTKDVASSILALSRLQHIKSSVHFAADGTPKVTTFDNEDSDRGDRSTNGYSDTTTITKKGSDTITLGKNNNKYNGVEEEELLRDLAHYAAFASAAYGWKLGLLSGGRLNLSSLAALKRKTGIQQHDVIAANWSSKTHLPAYFIVRDVERQKIVLSIRGTLSVRDVLTDLCCTAENFLTHDDAETSFPASSRDFLKYSARAHVGMLKGARGVAKNARKLIASELASNPHYDLIIVGHSLGGGTAAVLGTMWQDTFPGVVVYAYGCPCVGPLDSQPTINKSIISVVGEGDPFSCLSLGHLADISSALSEICEDHSLRNEILARTRSDVVTMSDIDLKWSVERLEIFQASMTAEKFYPPGRIMYMKGNLFGGSNVTLKEVAQSTFQHLKLHHRMLDLSRHIPHRYEGVLRRLSSETKQIGDTK